MQLLQALRAEGVSAVDEDAGDLLANVELLAAEVAKVQPSRLIVALDDRGNRFVACFLLVEVAIFLVFGTPFKDCFDLLLVSVIGRYLPWVQA